MLGKSAFAAEEGTLLLVASIFRCSFIHEVICLICYLPLYLLSNRLHVSVSSGYHRVTSFPITILALCRVLPNTGFRERCAQVINTLPGLYPCLLARPINPRWPLFLTMLCCRFSCLTHGEPARRDSLSDSELPLFIPASGIEDQSLPWGIGFYRTPRSGSHTRMVIELVRSFLLSHPSSSYFWLV